MIIEKKCNNCGCKLIIEENSLVFEEPKVTEVAICPQCMEIVYSGHTDGWFHVRIVDDINDRPEKAVVFPMS